MAYTLAVAFVLVALVVGLVANRWWRRSAGAADDGLQINDLVVPITTLAVLLLAFVMVEGINSYGRARALAAEEARIVNLMADQTFLLEDRDAAIRIQGLLICYTRAVRSVEWPAMASGNPAPLVSEWAGLVQDELVALHRDTPDADAIDRLLDSDESLGQTRAARLSEANPTIPTGLNLLMFGAVVVSIFGLAFFMRPQGSATVYVAVLVIFTLLTAATLWMISDLDRPFTGLNAVEPTELARIQPGLEADLAKLAPGIAPPCDAEGVPATE